MVRKFFFNVFAFLAAFGLLIVESPSAEAKAATRQKVITLADKMKGVPYVWGGATPRGFDCSGLVQYVFKKVNILLPRTADRQYLYGSPVPYAKAKPGDLMFFNTGRVQGQVTHVGIYMGNGNMLHAPRTGKRVSYASVADRSWFRPRLLGIRRVNPQTYQLSRQPVGWEMAALPSQYSLVFPSDAVQSASL